MNKLILLIAILAVLALENLGSLLSDPKFRADFLANFYSDLLVGIVIVWLIKWHSEHAKRLDIQLIGFIESGDVEFEGIRFVLLNKGDIGFGEREIYYHLFFTKAYEKYLGRSEKPQKVKTVRGIILNKIDGLIDGPVYPKRSSEFTKISLTHANDIDFENKQFSIQFLLSTPKGVIPKGATIEDSLGIRWGKLGNVRFMSRDELIESKDS